MQEEPPVNAKRFPATIVAVLFVSSILQYPVTHPARGLSFSEAEAAESCRFRLEERPSTTFTER